MTFVVVIWLHFLADFILQSNWIAVNKSKDDAVLLLHCFIYFLVFAILGWQYAAINAIMHFVTDYVTSRVSSYFWRQDKRHWFFTTIGADQAIHMTCLYLTMGYL